MLPLLAVSLMEGRTEAALLWAVLVGALLGFLPYNFHPARIFLGDSGSLLLGYLLAVLAVESLAKSATLVEPAVATSSKSISSSWLTGATTESTLRHDETGDVTASKVPSGLRATCCGLTSLPEIFFKMRLPGTSQIVTAPP